MAKIIARFEQTQNEELDYGIDYSPVLADGETIANSAWFISPEGLSQAATSQSDTVAVIYVTAVGAQGKVYTLVNRITTTSSPPRVIERAIQITVR